MAQLCLVPRLLINVESVKQYETKSDLGNIPIDNITNKSRKVS